MRPVRGAPAVISTCTAPVSIPAVGRRDPGPRCRRARRTQSRGVLVPRKQRPCPANSCRYRDRSIVRTGIRNPAASSPPRSRPAAAAASRRCSSGERLPWARLPPHRRDRPPNGSASFALVVHADSSDRSHRIQYSPISWNFVPEFFIQSMESRVLAANVDTQVPLC